VTHASRSARQDAASGVPETAQAHATRESGGKCISDKALADATQLARALPYGVRVTKQTNQQTAVSSGRQPGLRLLVLDDEETILWPVAKFFRGLGWEVVASGDPDEAEAVLENQGFAAVVLDLALSQFGRDGLDVLRSMRHRHPWLPVVILSAYISPEVEAEARQLGADAVLKKPLALPNLAQVVLGLTVSS
jgi:CheY-like chemotaxis protein